MKQAVVVVAVALVLIVVVTHIQYNLSFLGCFSPRYLLLLPSVS